MKSGGGRWEGAVCPLEASLSTSDPMGGTNDAREDLLISIEEGAAGAFEAAEPVTLLSVGTNNEGALVDSIAVELELSTPLKPLLPAAATCP